MEMIPWSSKERPTPVFLTGESHGQSSLVGYSLQGHEESDSTEWLSHFIPSCVLGFSKANEPISTFRSHVAGLCPLILHLGHLIHIIILSTLHQWPLHCTTPLPIPGFFFPWEKQCSLFLTSSFPSLSSWSALPANREPWRRGSSPTPLYLPSSVL